VPQARRRVVTDPAAITLALFAAWLFGVACGVRIRAAVQRRMDGRKIHLRDNSDN
jgi:hypothetical protein